MTKYICTVCGYIYDEKTGIPGDGIKPGTKFEDLPDTWRCPLCAAGKDAFVEQKSSRDGVQKPATKPSTLEDTGELSPLEVSALLSNLARGAEKQYMSEEAKLFTKLSDYFKQATAPAKDADLKHLLALVDKELDELFPQAHTTAKEKGDRGARRALTWSERVSRMVQSLLARAEKEGPDFAEKEDVYVCTICGFIYIGEELPEICPVCKVANWKFEKVKGRQSA